MTPEQLKSIVYGLARSTGLYGRLARDLDENDSWDELAKQATLAGCVSDLDFITWWEGG